MSAEGVGWYEFMKPGSAVVHVAHVNEAGHVFLPRGGFVSADDFKIASATDRFWKLVREPRRVASIEEAAQMPTGAVVFYIDEVYKKMGKHWYRPGSATGFALLPSEEHPATVLVEGEDNA